MTRQLNIRGDAHEPFATTPGPNYAFGTRMHVPDGRVFRRSHADATALLAGRTAQTTIPDAGLRDRSVVADGDSVYVQMGNVEAGNATAKDRQDFALAVDGDAARGPFAGDYNEGMLYVVSGGGAGHVYRIRRAEGADSTNNSMRVFLETNRLIASDASTRVTLYKNFFEDLAIAEAPPSAPVIGVSPAAVAADFYFWLQTQGAAAVLQEGGLQVNLPIAASPDRQGAVRHAVVVVPPLSGKYSASGVAVVNTIHPEDRGASRLMPVTGLGVVPETQLGYVIDPGYDGAQCLVHLDIEV